MNNPPCGGCPDRWVNEGGRCHDSCERFKAWRAKREEQKAVRLAKRKEESDVKIAHKRKCRL